MRELSPERELELATCLGIIKPSKPKEVAEFQAKQDEYKTAVSDFRADRLTSWGGYGYQRACNTRAIESIRQALDDIEAKANALDALGETTRLAVEAFEQSEVDYYNAIQAEQERPEREFENARNRFISDLKKEQRSLKHKATRTRNKSYEFAHDSQERKSLQDQALDYDSRATIVDYLISEAGYLRPQDDTPFTEQAILERLEDENSWISEGIFRELEEMATRRAENK